MPKRTSRGREVAHDQPDPESSFHGSARKQHRRKDYQLCGQVQRALAEALSADFGDHVLNELWIARVEPAPTVRRLLVWVAGPPDVPAALIVERLERVSGALRLQVGAAIHRKRTPFLLFAIYPGEQPGDLGGQDAQ